MTAIIENRLNSKKMFFEIKMFYNFEESSKSNICGVETR